jgi:hypothetical protein
MVQVTSPAFKANAHHALHDAGLQKALGKAKGAFLERRAIAVANLPEFERLRDIGRDIKNHTLAHLDHYLETYAANVEKAGGQVHWCSTADDARAAVLGICQRAGARTVTKGKSMISEEIGVNDHLEAHGIEPVETDLGEYIIQLRKEHPSHIIAPAFHLNREDWEADFRRAHTDLDPNRVFNERRDILAEARTRLRQRFLAADVGITGANFLIAETGSSVIVTNEGNGDLTQTLPRVHIVLASIEKVVPTLEDATSLLRPAGAQRHGPGFLGLHHLLHRRAAGGRPRRAGRVPRGADRQWPVEHDRHRVPGDAALHPLRGLHEPLPGLRRGGRARLWLGLSRPDGQRADAVAGGRGEVRPPAERLDLLRQVRERLPGEDPAAQADAPLARARIRTPPDPRRHPHQPAALGVVREAADGLPGGDADRHGGAVAAGRPARRLPLAAARRRLDRGPRPARARARRHLHGPLRQGAAPGALMADEGALSRGFPPQGPTLAGAPPAERAAPRPSGTLAEILSGLAATTPEAQLTDDLTRIERALARVERALGVPRLPTTDRTPR